MSDEKVKEEAKATAPPAPVVPEEAYRELEAIVGSEYITKDPVICRAYNGRGYGREAYWYQGITVPPAVVVMPQTTQEVARIVKVCNRYDVPYTCGATYWCLNTSAWFRPDFVMLDLKRMDKFEIDEKNMYITVQSHVIYAQAQAELMKRDLYIYVPGGGGFSSILANQMFQGQGILNYRISPWSERRANGAEWVTPEGDIVQMGSFVNDDKHAFWGHGPGPDLLGLLKGNTAWWGLFGIVTRISTRVYSFQPEKMEPVGLGKEGALQLPPRVHYQNYTLPSEDATKKAMLEISREQIAAAQNRVPMFWRTIARSQSRQDFWDEWNKVNKEAIEATHILRVLFIGFTSQKQLDYEMKVADDIMKKYGGEARRTKQTDDSTFLYPTANAMWKPTGFYASQMVALASPRCTWKTNADELKVLDNYEHFFFKQHGEHPWYSPFNLGRVMYSEFMAIPDCEKFDPTNPRVDPNTIGAFLTFLEGEVPKIMVENGQSNLFGMGFINSKNLLGPGMHNYHLWVQKLKKEFDPKGVCRKGCDDAMDVIIGSAPAIITEGFKQVAKRVAESGWKDTSGI